jgi:hypothetical protein
MIAPGIQARMEKPDGLPRLGIDPRKVRTLIQIAAVTGQSQICRIFNSATMLPGDNMLDVMDEKSMLLP